MDGATFRTPPIPAAPAPPRSVRGAASPLPTLPRRSFAPVGVPLQGAPHLSPAPTPGPFLDAVIRQATAATAAAASAAAASHRAAAGHPARAEPGGAAPPPNGARPREGAGGGATGRRQIAWCMADEGEFCFFYYSGSWDRRTCPSGYYCEGGYGPGAVARVCAMGFESDNGQSSCRVSSTLHPTSTPSLSTPSLPALVVPLPPLPPRETWNGCNGPCRTLQGASSGATSLFGGVGCQFRGEGT